MSLGSKKTKVFGGLLLPVAVFAILGIAKTAQATTVTFNYTGTIQSYDITYSGLYTITSYGALGGYNAHANGGRGAEVSGTIQLTAGEHLTIVVGGTPGGCDSASACGGGGGTWVFIGTPDALPSEPLEVAGGGGGGGGAHNGGDALAGTSGGDTLGPNGTNGSFGGTNGSGGQGGGVGGPTTLNGYNGGGGGGWLGNGGTGYNATLSGNGGDGPATFAGGLHGPSDPARVNGGFGGGGAGTYYGGGGGGGYSGGGGGFGYISGGGGGGGSYINSSMTTLTLAGGVNTGNGSVTLDYTTPEPSTYALPLGGFAAMGLIRRRRA